MLTLFNLTLGVVLVYMYRRTLFSTEWREAPVTGETLWEFSGFWIGVLLLTSGLHQVFA